MKHRLTHTRFTLCIILAIAIAPVFGQSELKRFAPKITAFAPLDEGQGDGNVLKDGHAALLKARTGLLREIQVIDFEKRMITFERSDTMGVVIWQYHYGELDEYLLSRQRAVFARLWKQSLLVYKNSAAEQKKVNPLEWELPVQYPSWAQRILGKEPPKLVIEGFERIIVAYDNTQTVIQGSNKQVTGTPGIAFNQENRFTIRGSVGRLISIGISAGSSEEFEMKNPLENFKIEYRGEGNELEDEIVQEVVAGYTGFSMPGARLSGYSENKEGLFGIKIQSKFGPLILTTIASNEQGESDKSTIRRGAGSSGSAPIITELAYVPNKYFFLDSLYLNYYNKKTVVAPAIKTIQVWRKVKDSRILTAVQKKDNLTKVYRSVLYDGSAVVFEQLRQDVDYTLEPGNIYKGCIRFDSVAVASDDIIGIYLRTADSVLVKNKGSIDSVGLDTIYKLPVMKNLWILKNDRPEPTDSTFYLMWRNIYTLPSFSGDNFTIKIYRNIVSGDSTEKYMDNYFSYLLGLTGKDGYKGLVNTAEIYDRVNNLLIIPPVNALGHVIGNQPFADTTLLGAENTNADMYNRFSGTVAKASELYKIQMSGTTKSNTISGLGWDLLQGTVKVKADGADLLPDRDYFVNYEMGEVELLSPKAKAAQTVDVEYQKKSFIPSNKLFLGAHGKVMMPFIGKNSFIGSSILFQNFTTQEAVPRLGQEPYSKLLLDVNTHVEFEPAAMTAVIDAIPLIDTEKPSTVVIDVEVAHSRMNPNLSGEASIEDFESSKLSYPLGVNAASWYKGAPPRDMLDSSNRYTLPPGNAPAWRSYWFTPIENNAANQPKPVRRDSIFSVITKTVEYETTLRLECIPESPLLAGRFKNPWMAITTPILGGYTQLDNYKYLEFYARSNVSGTLAIEYGRIGEDISLNGGSPNGRTDFEDKPQGGILVDSLNTGLDGVIDSVEYYVIPSADTAAGTWDTLKYRDTRLADSLDPARDNFYDYNNNNKNAGNYPNVNGTEKDGYLNTEDINNDNILERGPTERFFRHEIAFSGNTIQIDSAYVVESNAITAYGWRKYRIPISDTAIAQKIGTPTLGDVKAFRLVWRNFNPTEATQLHKLELARVELVGNQWRVPFIKDTLLARKQAVVDLSAINSEDNRGEYVRSPSVKIKLGDRNDTLREQSLRLNYWNLLPGKQALARRDLDHQELNLAAYGTISMQYYGDRIYPADCRFVFRFGTTDSTYYEYSTAIVAGWNTLNVNLRELTQLKLNYFNIYGDTSRVIIDSALSANGGKLKIYTKTGSPNFTRISMLMVGIIRDSSQITVRDPFAADSGEIWVNELKVGGIRDLNGVAATASISTQWADFMSIGAGLNYADGNFRTMVDNNKYPANSSLSGNLNASWQLQRFLPMEWGFNIPLSTNLSSSITRPQIKLNTDIALTDSATGAPDQLGDMALDLAGIGGKKTESSFYQTATQTRNLVLSMTKDKVSDNPLANLTIDKLKLDYQFTYNQNVIRKGKKGLTGLYEDCDTSNSHSGTITYNLLTGTAPAWATLQPLWFLPDSALFKPLHDFSLTVVPATLTFNVADMDYLSSIHLSAVGATSTTASFKSTHGFMLKHTPFSAMSYDFSLSLSRDLDESVKTMNGAGGVTGWGDFFLTRLAAFDTTWGSFGMLFGEQSRTQNASLSFNPVFFDWLTHTATLTSNYRQALANRQFDPKRYISVGVGSKFSLNTSLSFSSVFSNLRTVSEGAKPLQGFFEVVSKGFDAFGVRQVSFDYSSSSDFVNNLLDYGYLKSKDLGVFEMFRYSIGLMPGRTPQDLFFQDLDDRMPLGGMQSRYAYDTLKLYNTDSRHVIQSYTGSSSFNLPDPVKVNVNGSFKWAHEFTIKPDTAYRETTYTFPDISASANTELLNQLPFVAANMQRVNLTSSYTFNEQERHIVNRGSYTATATRRSGFSPLVRLDGTLKILPISTNYQHGWTTSAIRNYTWTHSAVQDSVRQNQTGDSTRSEEHTNSFGISYTLSKTAQQSEFKILWLIIPLVGQLGMGVTFEQSEQRQYNKDDKQTNETSSIALMPNISYDFTTNITGKAQYAYTERKENITVTTGNKFSLIAEIKF